MAAGSQEKGAVTIIARRRRLLFAPIEIFADAKRIAHRAAYAGYLYIAIGIIELLLFSFDYAALPAQITSIIDSSLGGIIVTQGLITLILLFQSWRVGTGRGYISATLLALSIAMSAWTVHFDSNILITLAYVAMTVVMIDGIRACWIGAKLSRAAEATVSS